MEKYRNRRQLHRNGGRFAKAPTLEQQGYDINTSGQVCTHCGKPAKPILKTWRCQSCQAMNQAD